MSLLEPKRTDDLVGKQVYFSGRMAPFHRVHYMQIYWATKINKGGHAVVFLVEEAEPLNQTCPFTFDQRKTMIHNCFPKVAVLKIKPMTSLENMRETREIIYDRLGSEAIYIGGEFQHIFAAKFGGYAVANYVRGMFDNLLPPFGEYQSKTRLKTDVVYSCQRYEEISDGDYELRTYKFKFPEEALSNLEVSASNVRKLMLRKSEAWKILIPPQNHAMLEELILEKEFQQALRQPAPLPQNPIKRLMKHVGWVH